MAWKCSGCHAKNASAEPFCEQCGDPRSGARGGERPAEGPKVYTCSQDGEPLMANGWCSRGGGWPKEWACRIVCERCRRPLEYSGKCYQCRTIPGDRYDLDDKTGHWLLTEKAPQRITGACAYPGCDKTAEQHRDEFRVLGRRIMARAALGVPERLYDKRVTVTAGRI